MDDFPSGTNMIVAVLAYTGALPQRGRECRIRATLACILCEP